MFKNQGYNPRQTSTLLWFTLGLSSIFTQAFSPGFIPTSSQSIQVSKLSANLAFLKPRVRSVTHSSLSMSSSGEGTLMDAMSASISKAFDREVKLQPTSGAGASGGGGAYTSAVLDPETGTKYFIKSAGLSSGGGKMLRAEYLGVKEMAQTDTIKVPNPVAYGEGGPSNSAFVIFEYLQFTGGGSGYELGKQLAKMHRSVSPDNKGFGFHVDNTIGATPQPNLPWKENWADFWDTHRLGHMLKLCQNAGYSDKDIEELRAKTKELLSHNPAPSLIHGDLWGGNKGYAKIGETGDIVPVIFDPATYYGDREADIAMTYVFGGFGSDFYEGYEDEWPLPEGHEKRRTVYNLYHILNHVSVTI